MKTILKRSILLIMMLLAINLMYSQEQKNFADDLTTALQKGDHHGLSNYFGSYLMIHIEDFQKVISAQQAKVQLKDFFSKNKAASVTLVKSGDKDKQQYCIWTYSSKVNQWRIYMLLTSEAGQPLIHQIDIEKAH